MTLNLDLYPYFGHNENTAMIVRQSIKGEGRNERAPLGYVRLMREFVRESKISSTRDSIDFLD